MPIMIRIRRDKKRPSRVQILIFLLAFLLFAGTALGEEKEKEKAAKPQGGGDLAAKVQNPVASMISVPFKNIIDFGAPNGSAYFLNIQPVIPITVGPVNLINRTIIPIVHVPGLIAGTPEIPGGVGGPSATGLGDINHSTFLSPANPGKVIWGLGPSLNFPSATSNQLGSGKWSVGPTAVVLTQPKPWTLGVLARQLWSFAGDKDRAHVNQFLLEPFVNYNLSQGWYLISDMVMTANWNADSGNRWTVPLGGGVGKLFKIGSLPINSRLEAYYNVEKPDAGPDWQMVFTFQFLFPK
jgi:hypothetical protein